MYNQPDCRGKRYTDLIHALETNFGAKSDVSTMDQGANTNPVEERALDLSAKDFLQRMSAISNTHSAALLNNFSISSSASRDDKCVHGKNLNSTVSEIFCKYTVDDLSAYLTVFQNQMRPPRALTKSARTRWKISDKTFDAMHDVSTIAAYNKLIIPKSSFGFWGGFLSSATEVRHSVWIVVVKGIIIQ